MKRILSIFLSLMILTGVLSGCGNTDAQKSNASKEDTNKAEYKSSLNLNIKTVPKNTVAGTVAMAEIMDELGIKLVGIPKTSQHIPDQLKNIKDIGMAMNPNLEKIKALQPDVYISSNSLKNSLGEKLKNQNIKAEFLPDNSYDDIVDVILALGKAYKKDAKAQEIVGKMKNRETAALKKAKNKKQLKVMIIMGTPGHFMLATKKSFTGNIVDKLGSKNITDDIGKAAASYVSFSMEQAISAKPDVILRLSHANPEQTKAMFDKEFSQNKMWQSFDAVKNKKVYDLNGEYFGVSGNIKAINALEDMEKILYEQ